MADKTYLWVDDVRMPYHWNYMSPEEREQDSYSWAMTYLSAIGELATGKYQSVSLDFSLDETDPRYSGLDVAKWILQEAQAGRLPRLAWTIHSIHPHASDMVPVLRAADRAWTTR